MNVWTPVPSSGHVPAYLDDLVLDHGELSVVSGHKVILGFGESFWLASGVGIIVPGRRSPSQTVNDSQHHTRTGTTWTTMEHAFHATTWTTTTTG